MLRSVAFCVGAPKRKVRIPLATDARMTHPKDDFEVWSAGSAAASQPTTGMNPASSFDPWLCSAEADITHGDMIDPAPARDSEVLGA